MNPKKELLWSPLRSRAFCFCWVPQGFAFKDFGFPVLGLRRPGRAKRRGLIRISLGCR